MYKEHPDLQKPRFDQVIWHYYSLSKFLGLIYKSSLYLCRHDKFDDSFEGGLSAMDKTYFDSVHPGIYKYMLGDNVGCYYSNCWTKSDVDEYVVLIDAGNEGDGKMILNHINTYYSQKYIDLAICTHCDSDHYGGFKELLEEHNNSQSSFKINQFWVHDPYKHKDVDDVKNVRKEQTLRKRLNDAYAFNDGSNLLEKIDRSKINRKEPFGGLEYSPMNIFVLGPDEEYYESLITDFRVDLDFKDEQNDDVYEGFNKLFFKTEDEFYSQTLEKANDDPSKVNQSSVIFAFAPGNQVYLFTGDAGREALMRVIKIDNNGVLKNVKWMKVPHHGSKHNLNSEIISYFHPSLSYISTEKYGKFANISTVNALKKVGKVYSTHKNRCSIRYKDGMPDREGYGPIDPL